LLKQIRLLVTEVLKGWWWSGSSSKKCLLSKSEALSSNAKKKKCITNNIVKHNICESKGYDQKGGGVKGE
jgi:hypothetical protein